jgi:predicted O-methyltransferase YrrM
MITLNQSPVKNLLARLYEECEQNDSRIEAEEHDFMTSSGGVLNDEMRASFHERSFMAVAPEVGKLLYLLVRSRRPQLVVEFGMSFGLSAIHIASALHDNGFGRLITTELSSTKARQAGVHLEQAGLRHLVEIRQGDAFQTLAGVAGIDLLLLDGWKPLYLPMLKQLEPALSPGCLVIADDVISLAEKLTPYLSYVRDVSSGYLSSTIPIDDGVELSIR